MPIESIRRLALGDLDAEALGALVDHGEDLFVERKRQPPEPPRFGAAVASFANTLGGWVLLGVADDKTIVGYHPPPRADLQSHLAELLRKEVDPLPPFVAEARELDGKQIVPLRVFESTDSPHIVRGTGAVQVRTSKGKEPVNDHRTLLELARRGEEAEERARARLRQLPVVGYLLRAPDSGEVAHEVGDVRVIARAAPLTVTSAVRDWPLTRRGGECCQRQAGALAPPERAPFGREGPHLEPYGRAVAARLMQETGIGTRDHVTVVADSGGVIGVEVRRGSRGQGTILLQAMLEDEIQPLAAALAALLYEAEAYGRAAVDLWLVLPPKGYVHEQQREAIPRQLHAAGELTVPAGEEEVRALALQWHRELQREVGVVKFEGEPTSHGEQSP